LGILWLQIKLETYNSQPQNREHRRNIDKLNQYAIYNFAQVKPAGMLNNVDNLPQASSLSTSLALRKVVYSCRSFWLVRVNQSSCGGRTLLTVILFGRCFPMFNYTLH